MKEMSKIVYGLWRIENINVNELFNNLVQMKELGINTIDTARVYSVNEFGDSERLLGEALKIDSNFKDYFNIVTKCGIENIGGDWSKKYYDYSYENIVDSAMKSKENLQIDTIDLFLLHRPSVFMNYEEVYKAFKYLKDNKIVDEFGVSNFTPIQFESLYNYLNKRGINLRTNQIEMNPLSKEHFENENVYYLKGKEICPMIWSPMAGGNVFKDNKVNNVLKEIAKQYNIEVMNVVISYLECMGLNSKIILGTHKIERYKKVMKNMNFKLSKYEMYKIYQTSIGHEIP